MNDMALPPGKTCADCASIRRCRWLIGRKGTETECDWSPSVFSLPAPATETHGGGSDSDFDAN